MPEVLSTLRDSPTLPTVGVDVGGTKVLAGLVTADGRVTRTVRRTTPERTGSAEAVEDTLVAAVGEVTGGEEVLAVGVAAAGLVDREGRRVRFAPHLPWRGEDVRTRLESRLGLPVVLDNDANAAAWAEYRHGAAQGTENAVVVTLGTGIGGALLIGGQVVRGRNGMAGEFGHMQVVPGGRHCECGKRGCWEQYCSGHALVRLARARIRNEPTLLEELCGGDAAHLTGPMVAEAAEVGDPVADAAFEEVGDWLGLGIANLVAAVDPEVVVVGGGLSAAGDRLLGPARAALARTVVGVGYRDLPPVVQTVFGPEAGMVGAAELARRGVEVSPVHR